MAPGSAPAPGNSSASAPSLPQDLVLFVQKEIDIAAPAAKVFEALLYQNGPGFAGEDGQSLCAKIEPWPGGRWYRDLGNNAGHLWGHVQVIKPPTLLELVGPFVMSYAVAGHIQYRVTPTRPGGPCILKVTHTAVGTITPEHRTGVQKGWPMVLERIKSRAEE